MTPTRRDVVRAGLASAAGGALAGCLETGGPTEGVSSDDGEADEPSAYASMFTLAEFARAVGGDGLAVENAVPAGNHGHGWEPPLDVLSAITARDAFCYLDLPGFQPWATDAARELESHHDDVALIDVLDGIDLLSAEEATAERADDHHPDDGGHSHDDGVHSHDTDHHHDNTDHHHDSGSGHSHDGGTHSHDDSDHHHDGTDHDDGGHSHGEYDAKFFADPLLAAEGVRNVRDGLIDLDTDHAEAYEANAAAYVDELEALHERYAEALADRAHDVVVLAGHNSFRYLAERHGFEIYTPVGLSADAEPSSADLASVVDFVEERGIEYVLWDYFDGPDLADLIVAEAETAVDSLLVSPAESVTEEWLTEGRGSYLAQLSEINLPAFERALGAR